MVADLDFILTAADSYLDHFGSGFINFDDEDSCAYAYSEFNNDGSIAYSVVNVATSWVSNYGTEIVSYSFQTYVHEIGHALGLGHLGNYNGSAGYTPWSNFANDSWQVSVMSYFDQIENTDVDADYGRLVGPMIADIFAIQNLCGAADVSSATAGNTTWGSNTTLGGYMGAIFSAFSGLPYASSFYSGNDLAFTIFDLNGTDTLDLSFATLGSRVDMRSEQFSDIDGNVGNLAIARGTVIEHLIAGSGADDVLGNSAANRINGGAGNDTLDGGAGNDTLTGGADTDTASYASAGAGATVSLALAIAQNTGGAGSDMLASIENLTGSGYSDTLTGSTGANRIDGGAGADVINGGAWVDTLDGGEGSDVYLVTLLADKTAAEIADNGISGTDELRFAATVAGTLTLSAGDIGLERVAITTGTVALNINAEGAANALYIAGNAGVNQLTGSAFADTIDGGAGNDILIGGAGSDSIIGGAGTDVLTGGEGDDSLTGGLGLDTLTGGAGADVFVFNTAPNTATNRDTIVDFVSAEDDIWLSRAVMSRLGDAAQLSVDQFHCGAGFVTAGDLSDRIIYNTTTGALYYDADGSGAGASIQIAALTGAVSLSFGDFFIF